jgi:ATP-dependent helicase Lhr and Lhr-like helicase
MPLFHPLIESWFAENVGEPSDIQNLAWPAIARGENVLLSAPTGSGKTLAAFLWAIDRLASGVWQGGTTRVLYISPLKALNADIERNLRLPLAGISGAFAKAGVPFPRISVGVRSGDSTPAERARMAKHPPEILITTPESLALILNSRKTRYMLSGVRTVILDEIHALAPGKRGSFLSLAVERIVLLSGELQRILLSATVNPVGTVAAFGCGLKPGPAGGSLEERPVTILRSTVRRPVKLTVMSAPSEADEKGKWPALVRSFLGIIGRNRSTLIFVNSRRMAEKAAFLLNQEAGREVAYAHHGSLSREVRYAVEARMKAGELPAVVATNSLELGIDIGSIDEVILVQCPASVSATIQRVGRSGHRLAAESRGTLFPTHGADYLFAAAQVPAVAEGDIEPLRIPERALDVLAQAIAGITALDPWKADDLFAFVRRSWPYRELSRKEFDLTLEMLAGRYAGTRIRELAARIFIDREDGSIRSREGTLPLLYSSGGTIPDRGYFTLRAGGARLGELDEEFVWERKLGETFSLGTQSWKIASIDAQYVDVVPWNRDINIIPFWRGDALYRPFDACTRTLELLDRFEGKVGTLEFADYLMTEAAFDSASMSSLVSFLETQERTAGLPHRGRIVLERIVDAESGGILQRIAFHTLRGGRVNYPLAIAARTAALAIGARCEFSVNDQSVLFTFTDRGEADRFLEAFKSSELLNSGNLLGLLREGLEESGFFGALFRQNAGRALLLPRTSFGKRVPLWITRQRSKRLAEAVSTYRDFPVTLETWRQVLNDELDIPPLLALLDDIESGAVAVMERQKGTTESDLGERPPSPFARELLWQDTDRLMYERDQSEGGPSRLSDELVAEVARTPELRPLLDPGLVLEFEGKALRLHPGYEPRGTDELADWLSELRYLPIEEWKLLVAGLPGQEDSGQSAGVPSAFGPAAFGQADQGQTGTGGDASDRDSEAAGTAPVIPAAIPVPSPTGNPAGFRAPELRSMPEAGEFIPYFLSYRGPLAIEKLSALLPYPRESIEAVLSRLVAEGRIVSGNLVAGQGGGEAGTVYCDRGNYGILLRLSRKRNRPSLPIRPAKELQDFLAVFSGIGGGTASARTLEESLERLSGYPTQAQLWEADILPVRFPGYRPILLDGLFASAPLRWYGQGHSIAFCLEDDLELFLPGTEADLSEDAKAVLAILGNGSAAPGALAEATGLGTERTMAALWELAFASRASSEGFAAVRLGAAAGFSFPQADRGISREETAFSPSPLARRFRKSALPDRDRWRRSRESGRWLALFPPEALGLDEIDREEIAAARARTVLLRYGVVFRELLERESEELSWKSVFRALRRMELSGEITSGRFFSGISGIQFASKEAVKILKDDFARSEAYWLNACDPASLAGIRLEGLDQAFPPRLAGTRLVFSGHALTAAARRSGRELDFYLSPGDQATGEACSVLAAMPPFSPGSPFRVEAIGGLPATESPYAPVLEAAGFERGFRTLTRY